MFAAAALTAGPEDLFPIAKDWKAQITRVHVKAASAQEIQSAAM